MKKNVVNWILGIVISALGICLCTKSDFGLSMIAACPYVLHVWLSRTLPWFTQGTAEYVFEAVVLIVVCLIIGRFRLKFLLSFLTAVLAGFAIDGWLWVLGGNGAYATLAARIIAFVAGMCVTSFGIAFFFRTTLPLEVYELAVTEISGKYGLAQTKVKLGFDICMLVLALAESFILTRALTGIGIGTVIMTFANAYIIAFFGRLIDRAEKNF